MDLSKFRMVPKDTMAKWEWIPGEAQAKASIQDLGLGGGSCSVDLRSRPGAGSSGKARATQAKAALFVWRRGALRWPQAPRHAHQA